MDGREKAPSESCVRTFQKKGTGRRNRKVERKPGSLSETSNSRESFNAGHYKLLEMNFHCMFFEKFVLFKPVTQIKCFSFFTSF